MATVDNSAADDKIAIQVIRDITDFLGRDKDCPVIADDKLYGKDIELDSLETFQLATVIGESFDLDIPDQEWVRLKTVKDVIDYVRSRQQVAAKGTE